MLEGGFGTPPGSRAKGSLQAATRSNKQNAAMGFHSYNSVKTEKEFFPFSHWKKLARQPSQRANIEEHVKSRNRP
jgi:hypothetical protein